MNIPQAVVEKAMFFVNHPNGGIKKIGEYKGNDAYHAFIKDAETGFPCILLYNKNNNKVEEFVGFDALKVLRLICKN